MLKYFGRAVDKAIVAKGRPQCESMMHKEVSLVCGKNFHEAPELVAMEPTSNLIVVEEFCVSCRIDEWRKGH